MRGLLSRTDVESDGSEPRVARHSVRRPLSALASAVAVLFGTFVLFIPMGAQSATAPKDVTIEVSKLGFSPASVSLTTGTTIIWKNTNLIEYPVIGGKHTLKADNGTFESPVISPGAQWTFQFLNPGTITYRDNSTPANVGTLTITGPAIKPAATEKSASIVEPNPNNPQGWGYDPGDIVIETGGTVTWRNNGAQTHTVTADNNSFDSGNLSGGATFKRTFDTAGAYTYHCTPHPWMVATIRVADAGQAPPPPAPATSNSGSFTGGSDEPAVGPAAAATRRGPITIPAKIIEPDVKQALSWTFSPKQVQAQTGDTVEWTNTGSVGHTITGSDFDSDTVAAGSSFKKIFSKPGVYQYACKPHPWMKGVVVVADTPGEAAKFGGTAALTGGGLTPGANLALGAPTTTKSAASKAAPKPEALPFSARDASRSLPIALGVEATLIAFSAAWILLGARPARERS